MRLPTLVRGILLWIVRDFPELQPNPGEARNPASDVTLAFRAPKLEGVGAPVYTLLTFDSGLEALRFLTRSSPVELARFHRAFYQAMDIAPGQAPEITAQALQEPPEATRETPGVYEYLLETVKALETENRDLIAKTRYPGEKVPEPLVPPTLASVLEPLSIGDLRNLTRVIREASATYPRLGPVWAWFANWTDLLEDPTGRERGIGGTDETG